MGGKITAYGLKKFEQMDARITNHMIPEYYKKKYGKPFHLVVLLQVRGNMPGIKKKRPVDIDEEISSIPGIIVMDKYFSCSIVPKLKSIFGKNVFPKPATKVRDHKSQAVRLNAHRSSSKAKINRDKDRFVNFYKGDSCIGCGKPFKVDIGKHPTNLCGCLKCFPKGIGFNETNIHNETDLSLFT